MAVYDDEAILQYITGRTKRPKVCGFQKASFLCVCFLMVVVVVCVFVLGKS
jgi:hypothetical protein